MTESTGKRLADVAPALERHLRYGALPRPLFHPSEIECRTIAIPARDGTRLATDLYLPPTRPAPVVAVRTPYSRSMEDHGYAAAFSALARRGFVVVAQDCRGTGDSEPDSWDYYVYESDDSYDLVAWITQQDWYNGFIGSCGSSYVGQTQWCMALHPAMSTLIPANSGLGVAVNTAHLYMFLNAYARSRGKGANKVRAHITEIERLFESETMADGYFNEPLHLPLPDTIYARFPELRSLSAPRAKRSLWQQYCAMSSSERAQLIKDALRIQSVTSVDVEGLSAVFGHGIAHDAHTIPCTDPSELARRICAPPFMRTGWYDWGLNDALESWALLRRTGRESVASRARLLITPYAHNTAGYHEGSERHSELLAPPNLLQQVGLMLSWYGAVAEQRTDEWPTVIYFLMGANEWRVASDWPVPDAQAMNWYLAPAGQLSTAPPGLNGVPSRYTYDPQDPTPTIGGSIVSYIYMPGSVDVSAVQRRKDVLSFTSGPLASDLDVVGPLEMILYTSSSATDTDFVVRLSDVFPDGRAIQLQSGILRARYRHRDGEPELLTSGTVYKLEISLWATANRFKAGHRLRVDVSSADFPRFDRNANRGGDPGPPVPAHQCIYHDAARPSHLRVAVVETSE
jgi:predicted acyl esterase